MIYIDGLNGPGWADERGTDPYTASYDDYTIGRFEKETKTEIPVGKTDLKRFAKRYAWLMGNPGAKEKWTEWRCAQMTGLYRWIAGRLRQARPDLELVLCPQLVAVQPPLLTGKETFPDVIYENCRRSGFDLAGLKKEPGIRVAAITNKTSKYFQRLDGCQNPFADDGRSGINYRVGWYEAQPPAPTGWVVEAHGPESYLEPTAEYFADGWLNIFVRTHPAFIVHGIQDIAMWMGKEDGLGRFAQAYRSLPVGIYTQLKGNGRDANVRMALTRRATDTYGYIANLQWWEVEATVEFAPAAEVTDLIEDRPVPGMTWSVRLPPYTMRTFRIRGAAGPDAVVKCSTNVAPKGRSHVQALLNDALSRMNANREALALTGHFYPVEEYLKAVGKAIAGRDYAAAFERLTYPDPGTVFSSAMTTLTVGPFVTDGWRISKMLPKTGSVATVPGGSLADAALEWTPVRVGGDGSMISVHDVYGDRDGIVYLGCRIRAPETADWILSLGHDGGAKLFVDGKEMASAPELKNPCRPDRTSVTMELPRGPHEVVVAFDTSAGRGWGIRFRFQTPKNKPRIQAAFPAP